jgi:hypothetical protein
MATQPSKSRMLLITAWAFLLLASGLPRIILQEVFGYEVSFKVSSLFVAVVIIMGLMLTLIWSDVRGLRQFFILFLVLVVIDVLIFAFLAIGSITPGGG